MQNQKEPEIISIDKEVLDIMGPSSEEAAPRMSSKTEKPIIVNKEITTVKTKEEDFQSKNRLKLFLTKSRDIPKYLMFLALIAILLLVVAVIPVSRYIISKY